MTEIYRKSREDVGDQAEHLTISVAHGDARLRELLVPKVDALFDVQHRDIFHTGHSVVSTVNRNDVTDLESCERNFHLANRMTEIYRKSRSNAAVPYATIHGLADREERWVPAVKP